MQFSKYHQPKHRNGGRKPSKEKQHELALQYQAEMEKRREKSAKAFEAFLNATEGIFDGFEFVEEFHKHFNKLDAIFITEANDSAIILTPFGEFKAVEDGQIAYFFSEKPTKEVLFNRSIYFF